MIRAKKVHTNETRQNIAIQLKGIYASISVYSMQAITLNEVEVATCILVGVGGGRHRSHRN